jgi:glycosyltransferase involved in cell wall biosynthesis
MKKVLLISGTVLHYRVSVYNFMWRRFREHGWDFGVLTNRLQPQNLRPIKFELREEPFSFSRYRRIVTEGRPDAVILFLHLKDRILWQLIHWLRWKRIPVVFWTKGGNLDEPDSRIRYHAFNYIFSRSDALIMYSADQLGRLRPRNRAKAVPANNTLNFDEIPAIEASVDEIKAEFNLPFRKLVLFVGTMGVGGERKKVEHLVEVFRNIDREDVGAVIVGAGMPETIRGRLNPRNTRYLGSLHDPTDVQVNKLFKASDLFVVPGHIGLGLNQAFFWGLPVVTEDGLQPPEIRCLKSGQNGYLVPSDDLVQLRDRILYLLDNDAVRVEFSHNARQVVREEASTENMFQGFRRAVKVACERRGVPGPQEPITV